VTTWKCSLEEFVVAYFKGITLPLLEGTRKSGKSGVGLYSSRFDI
jgi:hypothetical protein